MHNSQLNYASLSKVSLSEKRMGKKKKKKRELNSQSLTIFSFQHTRELIFEKVKVKKMLHKAVTVVYVSPNFWLEL